MWLFLFFPLLISANKIGEEYEVVTFPRRNATIFAYDTSFVCSVDLASKTFFSAFVNLVSVRTFDASYPQHYFLGRGNRFLRAYACFMHTDGFGYLWMHDAVNRTTVIVRGHHVESFHEDSYDMACYDNVEGNAHLARDNVVRAYPFSALLQTWSNNSSASTLAPTFSYVLPAYYQDRVLSGRELKVVDGQVFYLTNIGLLKRMPDEKWSLVDNNMSLTMQFVPFLKEQRKVMLGTLLSQLPAVFMYCLELGVLAFFVYCLRYKLMVRPPTATNGTYELAPPTTSKPRPPTARISILTIGKPPHS